MSTRFDRAPIKSYEELPDGRLRVRASFSRVGPLDYLRADGTVQTELVTADELFRQDSLETAALAPVTLGHPPVMVTPQNWKEYTVGATGSTVTGRTDEGLVDVVIVVGDQAAIDAVKTKEASEVSMGYTARVEKHGDQYFQTDRKYNHLALVPKGRAGPSVRVHMDADDDWAVQQSTTEKTDMPKIKGVEVPQLVYDEYTAVKEERDQLKTDSVQLKTDSAQLTTITAERDMYKAKVDEQKQELESRLDASEVAKVAAARLDAFTKAEPYLKDVKFDAAITAIEWKRQAIAAARPSIKLDGQTDDYINAAFDVLEAVGISDSGKETKQMLDSAAAGGDRSGSSLNHNDSDWDAQLRADEDAINKSYEQMEAAK